MKNTNSTIRLAIMGCLFSLFAIGGLVAQPQAITVQWNPAGFPGEVGWEIISPANAVVNCVLPGAAANQNLSLNPGTYTVRGYDSFGDGWNGSNIDVLQGAQPLGNFILATGGFTNTCNGVQSGGTILGTFNVVAPTCTIDCPADIVVDNSPGLCGANVTIPDPVVDTDCATIPPMGSNFLTVTGPNTPFNWAGSLQETTVDLPGVIMSDGGANVDLSVTFLGDFDFGGLEELSLLGPDDSQVLFENSDGQCVQTTLTVSINGNTWNNWVTTYGSTFTFTVEANTAVGDNICTGEFIQLEASIAQSSTQPMSFNNDYNFNGNASDFYPVGTTTVTYFAFDQGGLLVQCTFNVTVNDTEGPTFTSCPNDIVINLDPGACDAVVSYEVAAMDNCPAAPMNIVGPFCDPCEDPSGGSALACAPFAQNSIIQFIDLPGPGDLEYFTYNQETFGQEPLATIFIYPPQAPGVVPWVDGGFTPLGSFQFQTSNANNGQCVQVDFDTPISVPPGINGVWVEIFTPGTTLNSRIVQTPGTCDGNSATGNLTYINAPACGLTPPSLFSSIGFILDAGLTLGWNPGEIMVEQVDNSGLTSGDFFPIGCTTQTWIATDLAGNTNLCEFDVCVEEFPNPTPSLTCNDDVVIALDGDDCEQVLGADLLLEGGPYGCYEDYIVEIIGKGGDVLDGDDVGLTFVVRVTDPENMNNFCETNITVVDNIAPTITGCIDVTVSCNDDITPNAPISGTLRVGEGITGPIPETGTAGLAVFNLGVSLPPVDILDVDLSVDLNHTWVSDLNLQLQSPNGTTINLFSNLPLCTADNMDVTFDDEAAQNYNAFAAQCMAGGNAKEGTFQPQDALSAFDGSAVGQSGDWVLTFNDDTGGDSGNLDEVELKIDFAGNFPTPAAFDACGNVSFTFHDQVTKFGACDDIVRIITRTWTAVDESGNVSTCQQFISVTKSSFEEVGVPPNFDDIDEPALLCQNQTQWDLDGDGIPDPSVTGGPTGLCDNINSTFEDVIVPICENSFKVLRKWTLIDWCVANTGGEAVLTYNQIIKVADKDGPTVTCPPNATVNANSDCEGNYILPFPQIADNCSSPGNISIAVFDEDGKEYAPGDIVFGLPLGSYVFTYVATDDCGNESAPCNHLVTIEDNTPPVPICDEETVVSLGSDGKVEVCWPTFDDGSYDNCEILAYKVKRMDDPAFVQFADCVEFDCDDCGQEIVVRLRVYDVVGNEIFTENDPDARFNECMVNVKVDDKLDPVIVCPPNKTIDCWEFDPDKFDGVTPTQQSPDHPPVFQLPANVQIGWYPNAFDNCEVDRVNVSSNGGPDQCGEGTVTRIYTAIDKVGRTASCVQIITINNSTPFDICDTECWSTPFFGCDVHSPDDGVEWPCDITLTTCGAGLDPDDLENNPDVNPFDVRPRIFEDACDLVGVSYEDTNLPITPPGCVKLLRKWIVVDWCQPDNSFDLGYVTWTYLQEIKVLESDPPSMIGPCDDVTICGFEPDCEPIPVTLEILGTDDCTADEDLEYYYKIDAFFDPLDPASPTFDFNSDFNPLANTGNADNQANGSYPIGTHLIYWKVEDGCGNITTCEYTFTVEDCKAPTPIAKNLTVPVMPNNGMVCLQITSFENGDSYDNCTDYEDLVFSFEPYDCENPSAQPVTERCFDCGDVGIATTVNLYAYDEYCNFDFSETFVIIKDPNNVCPSSPNGNFNVTGAINNEDNEAVAKVEVTLNSTIGNSNTITTVDNGLFDFSVAPDANISIEPFKDVDHKNGVSTFDLVHITKHVLSIEKLNSPYKMIAADASNDGVVSTYDVVLLRKLILNIDPKLEFNTSWRFVDKAWTFPNANNPFTPAFPEVISINDIAQDQSLNDFVAIKIGDVTGDAKPNELVGSEERNFKGELVFATDDQELIAGETYTVDVKATDFTNILGYQYTMSFDNNAIELVDVKGNLSNLNEGNFGLAQAAEGIITTSWNAENVRVAEGETLFTLTFTAKASTQLSSVLAINSRVTAAEAYTTNLDFMNVALRFDSENGSVLVGGEFALYQNQPNPFKATTVIGFNLPKASTATLTIYDVAGKVVKSYEGDFAKGYNTITLERSELGTSGVLYYQLDTPDNTATKKMIMIE